MDEITWATNQADGRDVAKSVQWVSWSKRLLNCKVNDVLGGVENVGWR